MPAEWEPVHRIWLTPPHNDQTWPGCLEAAGRQFANLIDQMGAHVQPITTQSVGIRSDDSWIRDYGPIFVVRGDGGLACHDFVFDCWGRKYEPYDQDNAVPQQIAQQLGIPIWQHRMVLEGGSIEVNGAGTVMTTRQCLLDSGRNPGLVQAAIEQRLGDALGTYHAIWLPGGIAGDDTDGHIDDVARFINPTTIAAARAPEGHPDHDVLAHNWHTLEKERDQDGNKLNLVDLPVPTPLYYDYPGDSDSPGGRRLLPASYTNFLIANGAVFVPLFGQRHDEIVLRRLEDAMPGYAICGVRAEHLVVGLGTIHCLSMQQPPLTESSAQWRGCEP